MNDEFKQSPPPTSPTVGQVDNVRLECLKLAVEFLPGAVIYSDDGVKNILSTADKFVAWVNKS